MPGVGTAPMVTGTVGTTVPAGNTASTGPTGEVSIDAVADDKTDMEAMASLAKAAEDKVALSNTFAFTRFRNSAKL